MELTQLDFGFTDSAHDPHADTLKALRRFGSVNTVKHPIKELDSHLTTGYEFLSRANVPGAGNTALFLEHCRAQGILTAMDLHCLSKAAESATEVPSHITCHINLYPTTLAQTPVERIIWLLRPALDADARVCIELNEDFFPSNPRSLMAPVRALKAAGIEVAIDDVGCGRSCLESILLLEPDVLKIDKSLVMGVSTNTRRLRELKRLVRMIESLGPTLIAEGIESECDRAAVRDIGVIFGQGFLWGKPA
jgi:EAL domain-containing protein (putative c-di-GMP-specific phosphodiesterase class I)